MQWEGVSLIIVRRLEIIPRGCSTYLEISLDELLVRQTAHVVITKQRIAISKHKIFEFFNYVSDGESLRNFRFRKCDIRRLVSVVSHSSTETHTERVL